MSEKPRRLRGPISVEGGKKAMPPGDLGQFEAAQLRVVVADQEIRLKRAEIAEQKRKAAEVEARLRAELQALDANFTAERGRMHELYEEFERTYELKPENIAYDRVTGVITPTGSNDGTTTS